MVTIHEDFQAPWTIRYANRYSGRTDWPRVTILHSFYRSDAPSGENDTVLRQLGLLAEHGVGVSLLSVDTDGLSKAPGYRLRTALNVAAGRGASPFSLLRDLEPDVIHIHNLFPNISTQWLTEYSGAIVASLHNYRPACSAATLSRDGHDCQLCPTHSSIQAVLHRCYRNSRIATIPIAIRTRHGATGDPLLRRANVVLAPSPTMRSTYEALGVEGIRVLYQPTDPLKSTRAATDQRQVVDEWLFVGRLTPEKGIVPLVKAWPADRSLTVIGDGPLLTSLRRESDMRALPITFAGFVSEEERDAAMGRATGLIFPSQWREGAPAVYAEALARGLPVIALKGNAVADMVSDHSTGVVIDALDIKMLGAAMDRIRRDRPSYTHRCLAVHRRLFTVDAWLRELLKVYHEAGTS